MQDMIDGSEQILFCIKYKHISTGVRCYRDVVYRYMNIERFMGFEIVWNVIHVPCHHFPMVNLITTSSIICIN